MRITISLVWLHVTCKALAARFLARLMTRGAFLTRPTLKGRRNSYQPPGPRVLRSKDPTRLPAGNKLMAAKWIQQTLKNPTNRSVPIKIQTGIPCFVILDPGSILLSEVTVLGGRKGIHFQWPEMPWSKGLRTQSKCFVLIKAAKKYQKTEFARDSLHSAQFASTRMPTVTPSVLGFGIVPQLLLLAEQQGKHSKHMQTPLHSLNQKPGSPHGQIDLVTASGKVDKEWKLLQVLGDDIGIHFGKSPSQTKCTRPHESNELGETALSK